MKALYASLTVLLALLLMLACSSKASLKSTAEATSTVQPPADQTPVYGVATTAPTTLYVCVDVANVRSGPGPEYPILKLLQQGEVVNPSKKVGEWYYLGQDSAKNDSYIHESVVCSQPNAAAPPSSTAVSSCPNGCLEQSPGCKVKAHISAKSGDKLYYLPGDKDYAKTIIDPDYGARWFCTEAEALANGWQRAPGQ